jgi:hypothetical protein
VRTYPCVCGNTLFFDNSLCLACQKEVGFCPACRNVVALLPIETPGSESGSHYRCSNALCGAELIKCHNYAAYQVCNRCVPTETVARQDVASTKPTSESATTLAVLCDCCRFNATIPDLSVPGNQQKWYRLEAAKRRLFYDLSQLGLPYGTASDGIDPPLAFDFKADVIPKADFWRRGAKTAEKVYTGHANGRITINIREADDVEREKLRVELGEAHRTLIGHFRHEIGHYYWDMLVRGRREKEFIAVFGDHNHPTYAEALETYYKSGPPADWAERFISGYATMHPWEDFAETWATYLDMVSALDTAQYQGFGGHSDPVHANLDELLARYRELGVALNEINRSQGLIDVVPEVLLPTLHDKFQFVHDLVRAGREENGVLRSDAAA